MKIIIPMAGMGHRFIRAGHETPKPLVLVDGKPVIERVVSMFPGESDFVFICNSDHLSKSPMRKILNQIAPSGKVVEIAPHRLGPVHSVLHAGDLIEDDEPAIVNHCDFLCDWDYEDFKRVMQETKCAGSITAYKGFHPHSLGETYYAYLREQNNDLLEIKEKASFTNNRMDEYASAGGYYFAKGIYIKRFFKELVDRKINCNGEYYVSLIYNLMVEAKLPIYIYDLKHFLQWGTPEDLEEYQHWSDYFRFEKAWRPKKYFGGQCLIPMAGEGKRFSDAGYQMPKPVIPIDQTPMVIRKTRSSPPAEGYVFVFQKKLLDQTKIDSILKDEFGEKYRCLALERPTEGQLSSCLEAKRLLDPEKPLLIESCDNTLVWDEAAYLRLIENTSIDCIVWTFRNHANANRKPNMFGWVDVRDNLVKSVSVKIPISGYPQKDPGVIGTFWFRKAQFFFDAAEELVRQNIRANQEFYVDSCINVLVKQGRKAVIFDVKRYISFGTPNDLRTWEYWNSYFSQNKRQKNMSEFNLSIALPCYNEALNIPLLLRRYAGVRPDFPFELILVENGSTDNSANVLKDELKNPAYDFARVVAIPKNQGYGHGILTGLREAKGKFLAFSHADMQCDAKDVFAAYRHLLKSKNPEKTIVKGSRVGRGLGESIFTLGMTVIANLILRNGLSDINAQPKVFHGRLLEYFLKPPTGLEFDLYCLYGAKQLGWSIETIPVYFTKRLHGESKWAFNLASKMKHILNMIGYMFALSKYAKKKIRF